MQHSLRIKILFSRRYVSGPYCITLEAMCLSERIVRIAGLEDFSVHTSASLDTDVSGFLESQDQKTRTIDKGNGKG